MHCKDVSVREVEVPLTRRSIEELMNGRLAYKRTEYIVFRHGDEYAVVRLIRDKDGELFQKIDGYELVSLPEDTVYWEDPELDVLNDPALALVQSRFPGKTVVVKGMFSHINFIRDLEPIRLRVIDNIPPAPSKLGVLVRKALGSGFVEHPIVQENIDISMQDKVSDVRTEAVMFPCRVSNLTSDTPFYFLDDAPELEHDVTLIGCNLSKRIFTSIYKKDVPFINVCPADNIPDDDIHTIVKCCKVKNGHEKHGNVVMVPWGATVPEVVEAINDLFS